MAAAQMPVGRGRRADIVHQAMRFGASVLRQHLNLGARTRLEKSGPVGLHFAPQLLLRPVDDESALGAKALDEPLFLEDGQRLADGGARHRELGRQRIDRRDLLADMPVAGLDAAAEQG